jgi:hypothetical protein
LGYKLSKPFDVRESLHIVVHLRPPIGVRR